jgi:molybdenum cofactor biosynthesis enzyme MoaA
VLFRSKNIRLSSLVPVANKKITSSQDVDKVVENIKKTLLVELKDNDELNLD